MGAGTLFGCSHNSDIPVYDVKLESGKGATRTLHRNMLLPFQCMPVDVPTKVDRCKVKPVQSKPATVEDEVSVSEESDSSEDFSPVPPPRPKRRLMRNPAPRPIEPVQEMSL